MLSALLPVAADLGEPLRAEVAVHLAVAHSRLQALDEADHLLDGIGPAHDVVYAHALEYRGWVAHIRGDFPAAAQWFRDALAALSACATYDRYIEAKCLYGLMALCPELLATQEWPLIEKRVRRFDWNVDGLASWRFWVQISASLMCEIAGDVTGALRWAREARTQATDGYAVVALCRLAAVLRGVGETHGHADVVAQARDAYASVDVRALPRDLRYLPLQVAEEVAHAGDTDAASSLVDEYRDVVLPLLDAAGGEHERYAAIRHFVEATVALVRGDRRDAIRAFEASFSTLSRMGYRTSARGVRRR